MRTYLLGDTSDFGVERLQDTLKSKPFVECGNQDWSSKGWIPPLESTPDLYVLAAEDLLQIALQVEEKVLPAKVLAKELKKRVAVIEQKENRKMGRKEKTALKEQLTDELLPRAFTIWSVTRAYLDIRRSLLMVDTSSAAAAEEVIAALHDAMPAFSAALPRTVQMPYTCLTNWLVSAELPEGFEFGEECELEVAGEGGALIKAKNHDLQSEEIRQHLQGGKQCFKLGLIWAERMSFIVTHELVLQRVAFLDVLQEEINQQGEDIESLAKAEMLITVKEAGTVFEALLASFGGLAHAE
ncbi:recombination-associated protein RdgC [Chromobacterium piscinae]|uniref:recombination-associated protein RdgC n=1 Tax=Chromobacterium piscinae TaxID=686831 RepID=UPI001E40247D|nr:recombination-associated protein RdgC [Chromobacterium piscinae]MCD5327842.1 recombination-associated protein RdgC [Chromobacterium piscinae]